MSSHEAYTADHVIYAAVASKVVDFLMMATPEQIEVCQGAKVPTEPAALYENFRKASIGNKWSIFMKPVAMLGSCVFSQPHRQAVSFALALGWTFNRAVAFENKQKEAPKMPAKVLAQRVYKCFAAPPEGQTDLAMELLLQSYMVLDSPALRGVVLEYLVTLLESVGSNSYVQAVLDLSPDSVEGILTECELEDPETMRKRLLSFA